MHWGSTCTARCRSMHGTSVIIKLSLNLMKLMRARAHTLPLQSVLGDPLLPWLISVSFPKALLFHDKNYSNRGRFGLVHFSLSVFFMVTCVCFVIVLKMLYSVQHMSCLPWPCFSLAIWPAFAELCSKVKRLPCMHNLVVLGQHVTLPKKTTYVHIQTHKWVFLDGWSIWEKENEKIVKYRIRDKPLKKMGINYLKFKNRLIHFFPKQLSYIFFIKKHASFSSLKNVYKEWKCKQSDLIRNMKRKSH